VQSPTGQILAVEVKSGAATRTALQLLKDGLMATEGALLRGRHAPTQLLGERQFIETIVFGF
jgi:hypothetical protein